MCQVLRAEMYLRTVFPDIWPALEAAKAQRTNSSAGKRSSEGTSSWLQKSRKRVRDREYPAIVDVERLFCRVLSSNPRVLAENTGLIVFGGSENGGLKKSLLRAWALVEKGTEGSALGWIFGLSLEGEDDSRGILVSFEEELRITAEVLVRDRIGATRVVSHSRRLT
jgi:hypothetical protein